LLYMVPVYSLPILRQVRGPLTAYSYFLKYQVWQYIGIQSRGRLVPTKDKYLLLGRNMIPENVTVWNNRRYLRSLVCVRYWAWHTQGRLKETDTIPDYRGQQLVIMNLCMYFNSTRYLPWDLTSFPRETPNQGSLPAQRNLPISELILIQAGPWLI